MRRFMQTFVLAPQSPKKYYVLIENLVLVAEDVIVDIVLLGALWGENKGLHEPPHRLPIVRELAAHLNYHPVGQSLVGVHLPDFSMAVTEVQLHYFLMDFLLSIYGCSFSILSILSSVVKAAMHK